MKLLLFILSLAMAPFCFSQFTHADSIRGRFGPQRDWWDVTHYELDVTFDDVNETVWGSNTISFTATMGNAKSHTMQIDLQDPLVLDSIVLLKPDGDRKFTFRQDHIKQDGDAYFVTFNGSWLVDKKGKVCVYYSGKPHEAVKPPWDGGIIWAKDAKGNPWITVACQGKGASVWYPCKDTQADEPDSARMHFTCKTELACISNGHFEGKTERANGTATYTWFVANPINNYCIIPYIGDYVNIHEHYKGEKGMLELDYWVLRGNEEKAEQHFTDVPKTLEAFEHWFGPYPFYEDGYKLVEAPHLGMEHQSAIAYGNSYKKGYAGTDLSGTGVGLKWDFIIVHESGHEWFGNNITSKDIADMWIHESFTDYSETLFTEYWFGKKDASTYVIGLRRNILNDIPIIGPYGVNTEGSGDMYFKGANMLHTIRHVIDNDTLFREMLRGLNSTFYHQLVTTQDVEAYMSQTLKRDLSKIFDQYLRQSVPPTLELVYKKKKLMYRWKEVVEGFNMPVSMEDYGFVTPTTEWQQLPYHFYEYKGGKKATPFSPEVSSDFYILYDITLKKSFRRWFRNTEMVLPGED